VAKTVAALLNTEGDILIIGVDDEHNVLGLQRDFKTLRKSDRDGFHYFLI
jgi:predicted HTH transcriptional regulator